ncbi:hypothetical protein ADUPG1_013466 [Aduncisulcus paluster]|uniref:Polymerase nucleotidyl transferase domain-containing protein n=1 Tax=Aduncisulcus paluster TaxID=2918883 RepID=A0ABQ5K529_9EUKA|nr:hypothetical protein ADUPG1_013466 [Aduncisulcus paluster]
MKLDEVREKRALISSSSIQSLNFRVVQLLSHLQPTKYSNAFRKAIYCHICNILRSTFSSEKLLKVFPYGSMLLKTYLPDSDIDICCLITDVTTHTFLNNVVEILKEYADHEHFPICQITIVTARVPVVKCYIAGIAIDITANQPSAILSIMLLEEADRRTENSLVKRSVILCKTFIKHTLRAIGSQDGLLSTYGLEVIVLAVILQYPQTRTPLQVLAIVLDVITNFDWKNNTLTLRGIEKTSDVIERSRRLIEKRLASRKRSTSAKKPVVKPRITLRIERKGMKQKILHSTRPISSPTSVPSPSSTSTPGGPGPILASASTTTSSLSNSTRANEYQSSGSSKETPRSLPLIELAPLPPIPPLLSRVGHHPRKYSHSRAHSHSSTCSSDHSIQSFPLASHKQSKSVDGRGIASTMEPSVKSLNPPYEDENEKSGSNPNSSTGQNNSSGRIIESISFESSFSTILEKISTVYIEWKDRLFPIPSPFSPTQTMNILDPLDPGNNLGAPVRVSSFYRLQRAFRVSHMYVMSLIGGCVSGVLCPVRTLSLTDTVFARCWLYAYRHSNRVLPREDLRRWVEDERSMDIDEKSKRRAKHRRRSKSKSITLHDSSIGSAHTTLPTEEFLHGAIDQDKLHLTAKSGESEGDGDITRPNPQKESIPDKQPSITQQEELHHGKHSTISSIDSVDSITGHPCPSLHLFKALDEAIQTAYLGDKNFSSCHIFGKFDKSVRIADLVFKTDTGHEYLDYLIEKRLAPEFILEEFESLCGNVDELYECVKDIDKKIDKVKNTRISIVRPK